MGRVLYCNTEEYLLSYYWVASIRSSLRSLASIRSSLRMWSSLRDALFASIRPSFRRVAFAVASGSYHPSSPISGWRLGKVLLNTPIRKGEVPFLLCVCPLLIEGFTSSIKGPSLLGNSSRGSDTGIYLFQFCLWANPKIGISRKRQNLLIAL
jgi:hypothetical protein